MLELTRCIKLNTFNIFKIFNIKNYSNMFSVKIRKCTNTDRFMITYNLCTYVFFNKFSTIYIGNIDDGLE